MSQTDIDAYHAIRSILKSDDQDIGVLWRSIRLPKDGRPIWLRFCFTRINREDLLAHCHRKGYLRPSHHLDWTWGDGKDLYHYTQRVSYKGRAFYQSAVNDSRFIYDFCQGLAKYARDIGM